MFWSLSTVYHGNLFRYLHYLYLDSITSLCPTVPPFTIHRVVRKPLSSNVQLVTTMQSNPYGQPAPEYSLEPFYRPPIAQQAGFPPRRDEQQYHHHRVPGDHSERHPNLVGQPGMPDPAPLRKGHRPRFTFDDDQLLVDLKEKNSLTWKQIADFFPGRSSSSLEVRYCTRLKTKATVWTDEMVQKLRNAMADYENDRWRIISAKVGNGFSPTTCRDKALDLAKSKIQEEEE
ncbi:hypothetical protein BS50DRAFT_289853 [Corynespora cassiicola Philippines]|uniref:Myb-like domain-containing protein n=1 Tax=Corynespora cassiicola Philippines TaxID=1448308 RepID=A0A2T2N124_CORCC|nr:hypothetical protein BS50DRAFT_289853 [Corynespora cassiicola Philippines]